MKKLESALKYTRIALGISFLAVTILLVFKIQNGFVGVVYLITVILFFAQLLIDRKIKKASDNGNIAN